MKMFETKDRALKVRDFALKLDGVTDDGSFSGYGSVFGVMDSYREIVEKGAFEESLQAISEKGRKVPVLWQHLSSQPIGVYEEIKEDEKGLFVKGRLLHDSVSQAKEAFALMKAEIVSGLSIGYYVVEDKFNEKDRVRTLTKLDLVECSVVTFPANDDARIENVKRKLAHGSLPSLPEFERLLREAGFSKSQSAVIANRGLASLLRSESGDQDDGDTSLKSSLSELRQAISSFEMPKL